MALENLVVEKSIESHKDDYFFQLRRNTFFTESIVVHLDRVTKSFQDSVETNLADCSRHILDIVQHVYHRVKSRLLRTRQFDNSNTYVPIKVLVSSKLATDIFEKTAKFALHFWEIKNLMSADDFLIKHSAEDQAELLSEVFVTVSEGRCMSSMTNRLLRPVRDASNGEVFLGFPVDDDNFQENIRIYREENERLQKSYQKSMKMKNVRYGSSLRMEKRSIRFYLLKWYKMENITFWFDPQTKGFTVPPPTSVSWKIGLKLKISELVQNSEDFLSYLRQNSNINCYEHAVSCFSSKQDENECKGAPRSTEHSGDGYLDESDQRKKYNNAEEWTVASLSMPNGQGRVKESSFIQNMMDQTSHIIQKYMQENTACCFNPTGNENMSIPTQASLSFEINIKVKKSYVNEISADGNLIGKPHGFPTMGHCSTDNQLMLRHCDSSSQETYNKNREIPEDDEMQGQYVSEDPRQASSFYENDNQWNENPTDRANKRPRTDRYQSY